MPPMDQMCFLSNTKAHVNYINISLYDNETEEAAVRNFKKLFELMPKFQYKVKEIAGDYYYEKMSVEETFAKAFPKIKNGGILNSREDIDAFSRDNLNTKMPLDGPQWRMYAQNWTPTDEDDLPDEHKSKGITIFKGHHSFCDGVSVMCMTLSLSEDYSRDYFIKSSDAKWYEALFIRIIGVL